MILCADALHDDSASVCAQDDDAEGHVEKQLFGPLHPSKPSLWRVNPLKGLGHRDESFRIVNRMNKYIWIHAHLQYRLHLLQLNQNTVLHF